MPPWKPIRVTGRSVYSCGTYGYITSVDAETNQRQGSSFIQSVNVSRIIISSIPVLK